MICNRLANAIRKYLTIKQLDKKRSQISYAFSINDWLLTGSEESPYHGEISILIITTSKSFSAAFMFYLYHGEVQLYLRLD
jgi:hypothetical protein